MYKTAFLMMGLTISLVTNAQERLSVYLQGVTGGQWVKNPERPEDGTFSYNFKVGWGGGMSYDLPLSNRFSLSYRLNYVQKGFQHTYQDGTGNHRTNQDLHYVGLDQILKFRVKQAYLLSGIRNDRLVYHNLDDQVNNQQAAGYINTADYHRWSFGGITGLGYRYERFSFEGGMNYDIAPSLRTHDTLIRNFIWYANLGFYIL